MKYDFYLKNYDGIKSLLGRSYTKGSEATWLDLEAGCLVASQLIK